MQDINKMPANAKTWIFAANRKLSKDEQYQIENLTKDFTSKWVSHNQPVVSDFEIMNDVFLVMMVDENSCHLGGCGSDDLFNFVKETGAKLNLEFLNRLQVEFLKDGETIISTKQKVIEMHESGKISDDTIFFNKNILYKSEFEMKFNTPFSEFWIYKGIKQIQSV